jgi:hypothetical protein
LGSGQIKEVRMAHNRFTPERIAGVLIEVEVDAPFANL